MCIPFVKAACSLALAASLGMAVTTKALAGPRPAAIVVDAKSGKVMYQEDPDGLRYPASLTKMMTLYLVFEALETGRISLNSRVPVSRHAAGQAPSKLGIRAGQTFTVEQGIMALVTRSANDCSTAFAEFLGGSEPRFGKMMTAKARSLGMTRTVYFNANGLPDPRQVTTARDQARLGVALRKHFPEYYGYFSIRSFRYGKQVIPSHNRLVGKVQGVDGIKTGFTRAAGFNLVTSAQFDGRSIVGVVLGGTSTPQRDTKMRRLVETYLPLASRRGSSDAFVSMDSKQAVKTAYAAKPADREDDRSLQVASADSGIELPSDGPLPQSRYLDQQAAVVNQIASADDQQIVDIEPMTTVPVTRTKTIRITNKKTVQKNVPIPSMEVTRDIPKIESKAETKAETLDSLTTASTNVVPKQKGWVIQVGAAPGKSEAMSLLQKAQDKGGKVLRSATPFTVAYNQMYRARFSGFRDQGDALNACKALKRKGVSCWASLQ